MRYHKTRSAACFTYIFIFFQTVFNEVFRIMGTAPLADKRKGFFDDFSNVGFIVRNPCAFSDTVPFYENAHFIGIVVYFAAKRADNNGSKYFFLFTQKLFESRFQIYVTCGKQYIAHERFVVFVETVIFFRVFA